MPKGIYKKTEDHKKKIRESNLAHPERHLHWLGRHHTDIAKKKIGLSNRIAQKGKKLSDTTKQKISDSLIGEKNPSWRGGIRKIARQEHTAGRPKPSRCEICNKNGRICFDHCHRTGKFRGWICSRCNVVLGLVNDDIEILKKLINYLK